MKIEKSIKDIIKFSILLEENRKEKKNHLVYFFFVRLSSKLYIEY